jgi:hypothetical protein
MIPALRTSTVALFTLVASTASAFPITVNPGAYGGRYQVFGGSGSITGLVTGVQNVNLSPGSYVIDDGAGIAGSAFPFTVDSTGNVSTTSASATAFGTTVGFNTVVITVNPQAYAGQYVLSSYSPATFTGSQSFVLMPCLSYAVDDGAFVGGSGFDFSLDCSGNVSTTSLAAAGSGATLTFNPVSVTVNPGNYSGLYSINTTTGLTGVRTISLISSLVDVLSANGQTASFTASSGVVTPRTVLGFTLTAGSPVPALPAWATPLLAAGVLASVGWRLRTRRLA